MWPILSWRSFDRGSSMFAKYISDAGPLGLVIIGLSVVAMAVVIERAWFWFFRGRPVHALQRNHWLKELKLGSIPEPGGKSPEARALQYLFDHYHTGDDKILDIALSREVRETNRFLSLLDTVAAAAPMLGILGTVIGIIQAFGGMKGDAPDTAVMVAGISVAMLTTAMGLIVALISLVSFNLFSARAHKRQIETAELLQEAWVAVSNLKERESEVDSRSPDLKPVGEAVETDEQDGE